MGWTMNGIGCYLVSQQEEQVEETQDGGPATIAYGVGGEQSDEPSGGEREGLDVVSLEMRREVWHHRLDSQCDSITSLGRR